MQKVFRTSLYFPNCISNCYLSSFPLPILSEAEHSWAHSTLQTLCHCVPGRKIECTFIVKAALFFPSLLFLTSQPLFLCLLRASLACLVWVVIIYICLMPKRAQGN